MNFLKHVINLHQRLPASRVPPPTALVILIARAFTRFELDTFGI
jgi:hypothetical protein